MTKYLHFESIYSFSDREDDLIAMEAHCISDSETPAGVRLTFEDNVLVKVEDYETYNHDDDPDFVPHYVERSLEQHEVGFRYREFAPLEYRSFIIKPHGLSSIGGCPPEGVTLPTHPKIKTSCQYIGHISKQEKSLEWLPFDLHLFYPMYYFDIMHLYFDYSNPDAPKIIDTPELDGTSYAETLADENTHVEYEQYPMGIYEQSTDESYFNRTNLLGFAGIPNWIQWAYIPKCPYTKKPMKFVSGFYTCSNVKVAKHNLNINEENDFYHHDYLDFWGEGHSYIFMNPETKTLCFFMQNT